MIHKKSSFKNEAQIIIKKLLFQPKMLVAPTYCFYCGDDETIVRVGAQENTQKFFMRKNEMK